MIQSKIKTSPDTDRSGSVWDYVSVSRLNLWIRCPLAFKLRYLDGIRTPTSPALFLGQRVHHGLEIWYRHRQLGIPIDHEDLAEQMLAAWDQAVAEEGIQFASSADEQSLRDQAIGLIAAYLGVLDENEPPPLAVETCLESPLVDPTTGEDLGIKLLGIVDLVLPGQTAPVIIDFKTASKSAAPIMTAHEIQLAAYAYLFRSVTGERESELQIRSLIKTKTPKIATHKYESRCDAHFRRLFAVIREYLDALGRGVFNYRPSWSCGSCDFRDKHCQQWSG